ncbi:peptidoglycan DD-metalloendopeptidase family protein [Egbenema bharatensis]|uniref:peptidoglycan DD-metalloendopeptidase family protein n=1 Tax=Egbenema bharatensis TaxID=3463334 RepID=UPI003A8B2690
MKRAHLRKDRFVSCSYQATVDTGLERSESGQSELEQSEGASLASRRRVRTSAAMLGLALSMGATGALLPQQDDGAAAAEPRVPNTAIAATLPVAQSGSPLSGVRWVEHIVREGQSIQQVASHYQVNGWSVAVANGLTLDSSLRTGQVLRVPVPNRLSTQIAAVEPNHLEAAQSSTLVASANLEQLSGLSENESASQIEVERNQSLERLRQQRERLRESLAELRYEESNSSNSVVNAPRVEREAAQAAESGDAQVGGKIPDQIATSHIVPTTQPQSGALPGIPFIAPDNSLSPSDEVAITSDPQAEVIQPGGLQLSEYRVSPGDTVAGIARAHNIPQSLLIEANGLRNPNVIFVGQVLSVPSTPSTDRIAVPETSGSFTLADALPVAADSVTPQTDVPAQYAQVNESVPVLPSPQSSSIVTSPVPASSEVVSDTQNGVEQIAASPDLIPMPEALAPTSDAEFTPSVSDTSVPSGANPYVASLLTEIRAMRQQRSIPPSTAVVVESAPEETEAAALPEPAIPSEVAVNPHMNQAIETVNEEVRPVSSSRPDRDSTAQPEMVAAAPLGSESYDPLLQPITGRMVSPELPPLPGADTFLPEDGIFNGFIWPARGVLTSGYGWRWGRMHRGIDIAADVGTPIYAAATGVIEFAGWNSGGYGNMVEVRHPDGTMTRYAHMNAIHVRNGQRVSQGEQLGEMGSTGYSTGPHLHFEVHIPAQGTVNPMAYLPAR